MSLVTERFLRSFFATGAACLAGMGAFSCVDPSGSYQEFVDRTNGVRGVVPSSSEHGTDGGSACSNQPSGGTAPNLMGNIPMIGGTYFAACLATIAVCNTAEALRFRIDRTFDPTTNTGTDTVTPLVANATSLSSTVGTPFQVPIRVSADGSFTSSTPDAVPVPGAANAFSGNDLTIMPISFTGHILDADHDCSELDGVVHVLGNPIDLSGPGDVCIYVRASSVDETFDPQLADYHCP